MKKYFSYTRVSTTKQGEGVSLQEQRAAIERYATREGLQVIEWFEEMETAAKRGRPIFTRMMRRLQKGDASGVVIHKIDRSARNLKDWAELGELIDQGIEVHFANESLDLATRGGRLTADIQAVVAADYVRNLREETKKGLYGRLKQGIYPFKAPLGYLDNGGGKLKTIDPVMGPLVRETFELYATGRYGLRPLLEEMKGRGLKTKGGTLTLTGFHKILRNPFYTGIILIKKSGETFQGKHEPLISHSLFDRVQNRLVGKYRPMQSRHTFAYARLLKCLPCGRNLIGEKQKGHVYYRCHSRDCLTTTLREDRFEERFGSLLDERLALPGWARHMQNVLLELQEERQARSKDKARILAFRLGGVKERLAGLAEKFLDGDIDRESYLVLKEKALSEVSRLEEEYSLALAGKDTSCEKAKEILELGIRPSLSLETGNPAGKREFVETVTSNRGLDGENVFVELSDEYSVLEKSTAVLCGGLSFDIPRNKASQGKIIEQFVRELVERLDELEEKRWYPSDSTEHSQEN